MITQQLLQKQFNYNPTTGIVSKRITNSRTKVGTILGYKDTSGHLMLEVNGVSYNLHRLCFLYHYGYLPEQVDHINGKRTDNKIDNLRACSLKENTWNRKIASNNFSTGIKGISKGKTTYNCQVVANGIKYRKCFSFLQLGNTTALIEAKKWTQDIRLSLHGEFANHG